MPFDPSLPAPNSPLESQVIRDQLQALFNLSNSIVTVTAAQVDGVSTVEPGTPARLYGCGPTFAPGRSIAPGIVYLPIIRPVL